MTHNVKDWVDIYLSSPKTQHIQSYPSEVVSILQDLDKETVRQLEDISINFENMMKKYGRFWSTDEELFYRTNIGTDEHIKQITIGNFTQGQSLISRVNGTVVPTICLEQLRLHLNTYHRNGKYEALYNNLNNRKHDLHAAVEKARL